MSLKIDIKVLDDLCSRFLLNIPESEKNDMIRLCFHIELAHWFYLDFFRPENLTLPECRMREFAKTIFEEYPFLLNPSNINVDEVLEKWKEYKRSVPTYGAILLDSSLDNVLLVQGFWIKASWGFPKGKVNKSESPEACAAREVLEETGYNITGKIDKTQFAEHFLNEQLSRLYYVTDVPMDIAFKPKTRGEIKSVQWFNVDDLPAHKKDNVCKRNLNLAPNCFFMVIPFVKQIRRWIASRKANRPADWSADSNSKLYSAKTSKSEEKKQLSKTENETSSFASKTRPATQGASWTINKIKPESAKLQMQQFSQKNTQELEIIKSLMKDPPLITNNRGGSPQQRRRVYGRGRGERLNKQYLPNYGPASADVRKGRGSFVDSSMPEAWKNFTFDREKILQAITAFNK